MILLDDFYDFTKNEKTNIYIETGTYKGNGIKRVLNQYENIHSIELSKNLYDYNCEQFLLNKKVFLHLGDSKKILPNLLNTIDEPVTIFLDAHYSGIHTAFGEEETPILHELEILKNHPYDDIIIIDDCRCLNKSGTGGRGEMITDFNWIGITEEKILNLMKPDYILLKNDSLTYIDYHRGDQFILCKNNFNDCEEKKLIDEHKITKSLNL
jgi:hypothetical protein